MIPFKRFLSPGLALACLSIPFSSTSPAEASSIFYYQNVSASTTGNEANALNDCVRDAGDGIVSTSINKCNQVSIVGNTIVLKGVDIKIYPFGSWQNSIYQNTRTDVNFSGGSTEDVIQCVEDARDGTVTSAISECRRSYISSAILYLNRTNAAITG